MNPHTAPQFQAEIDIDGTPAHDRDAVARVLRAAFPGLPVAASDIADDDGVWLVPVPAAVAASVLDGSDFAWAGAGASVFVPAP